MGASWPQPLGPARVGATAGAVDHPPVVGLARFFVKGGPGARHCARSTPGSALVRPILGRRFQIASGRHIMAEVDAFVRLVRDGGPIGALDAALPMRCGSPQLRTESSPSSGQSQSPQSRRSGGIGGPRFGRAGQSCRIMRRRRERTRRTGWRLWRRTGAIRPRGVAVPAGRAAGRGGPPAAPVCCGTGLVGTA